MHTEVICEFVEAGLDCLVLRMISSWGLWHCGYVRIPEGTALHNVGYSEPVTPALETVKEAVLKGPVGKRGSIPSFLIAMGKSPDAGDLIDVHGSVTFSGALRGQEGYWWGFDVNHSGDEETGLSADPSFAEEQTRSMAKQLSTLLA